jgi:predicted esterase
MLAPDVSPMPHESLLREMAEAHKAVIVTPRGRAGLCAWSKKVETWWCWPTSRDAVDSAGPSIVADWQAAQAALERRLAIVFDRRYVFGFSNGGYFAAYIGLEGFFRADGIAVVGAGRNTIDAARVVPTPPPFYIAVGDQEVPVTILGAENLASFLSTRGGQLRFVLHTTREHELRREDFDAAFAAWEGAGL